MGALARLAATVHGACGLAVLTLLVAPCLWAARRAGPFRPMVPAPDFDLAGRLAYIAHRHVTPSELESFRRFGVHVFRNVLPDRGLLKQLVPAMELHRNFHSAEYTYPMHYNGVVRDVLRQGHLTGPVVELFGIEEATLSETPIWGIAAEDISDEGSLVHTSSAWHVDSLLEGPGSDFWMLTGWLAVTDAPHSLEFLRGTHEGLRTELYARCNESWRIGKSGERTLDGACVARISEDVLDKRLGYKSHMWVDAMAGDLIVFDGRLLHRGVKWGRNRLALSFRMFNAEQDRCRCNRFCSVHSWKRAAGGGDPLACLSPSLVAQPFEPEHWDDWNLLPPEGFMTAGTLRLRRLAGMLASLPRAAWGRALMQSPGA